MVQRCTSEILYEVQNAAWITAVVRYCYNSFYTTLSPNWSILSNTRLTHSYLTALVQVGITLPHTCCANRPTNFVKFLKFQTSNFAVHIWRIVLHKIEVCLPSIIYSRDYNWQNRVIVPTALPSAQSSIPSSTYRSMSLLLTRIETKYEKYSW
jgi:hypothetical protein